MEGRSGFSRCPQRVFFFQHRLRNILNRIPGLSPELMMARQHGLPSHLCRKLSVPIVECILRALQQRRDLPSKLCSSSREALINRQFLLKHQSRRSNTIIRPHMGRDRRSRARSMRAQIKCVKFASPVGTVDVVYCRDNIGATKNPAMITLKLYTSGLTSLQEESD